MLFPNPNPNAKNEVPQCGSITPTLNPNLNL